MTSQEPQLERWKTEETRVVLDKSPWLVVEEHTVSGIGVWLVVFVVCCWLADGLVLVWIRWTFPMDR